MNQRKDFVIRARCDSQVFGVVEHLAQAQGTSHSAVLREIVRDFGQRCGVLPGNGDQQAEQQPREEVA